MYKANFPQTKDLKITQSDKDDYADSVGISKVFRFAFGQGYVEELFSPVLKKLGIDKEEFFDVFWKHIFSVSE